MSIVLFEHQKNAVEWLKKVGSGLVAAATGTGKTLIAATYAQTFQENGRILIICPSSVRYQWKSELKKYYGITSLVIEGTSQQRSSCWTTKLKYKIVNYELLLKDYKYALPLSWDLVVADESHRLANPRAKTVKIIKKLSSRHRVALTATPICNGKYDLFSQIDWIKPGCLGHNWWSFRSEYCIIHAAFPKIIGYRNENKFSAITTPLIYRIDKSVLTSLPAITETVIGFNLSSTERRIYNRAKEELRIELEGQPDITIANALVKLLRLRQLCNGSSHLLGSVCGVPSKLQTLLDLLSDILEDKESKVIIFTSFAETAKEYFQEINKLWQGSIITGDTPQSQRLIELSMFEHRDTHRFLIGTEAIAVGLNLQHANLIINIDEPWSFSKYDQRLGRAWRQGQKKHVQVYSLIAKETVDVYVHQIIEKKKNEVDITLNTIKEILC